MQYPTRVVVLVGCVGAAVGWFAHSFVGYQKHQDASAVVDTTATAPILGGPKDSVDPPKPDYVRKAAVLPASDSAIQAGRVPPGSSAPDLLTRQAADQKNATIDGADPRTHPISIEELRNSTSIGCTFGPGNSAEWPNGKVQIGTSAWQDGPVEFFYRYRRRHRKNEWKWRHSHGECTDRSDGRSNRCRVEFFRNCGPWNLGCDDSIFGSRRRGPPHRGNVEPRAYRLGDGTVLRYMRYPITT